MNAVNSSLYAILLITAVSDYNGLGWTFFSIRTKDFFSCWIAILFKCNITFIPFLPLCLSSDFSPTLQHSGHIHLNVYLWSIFFSSNYTFMIALLYTIISALKNKNNNKKKQTKVLIFSKLTSKMFENFYWRDIH